MIFRLTADHDRGVSVRVLVLRVAGVPNLRDVRLTFNHFVANLHARLAVQVRDVDVHRFSVLVVRSLDPQDVSAIASSPTALDDRARHRCVDRRATRSCDVVATSPARAIASP